MQWNQKHTSDSKEDIINQKSTMTENMTRLISLVLIVFFPEINGTFFSGSSVWFNKDVVIMLNWKWDYGVVLTENEYTN